jgi:hypothetical protein
MSEITPGYFVEAVKLHLDTVDLESIVSACVDGTMTYSISGKKRPHLILSVHEKRMRGKCWYLAIPFSGRSHNLTTLELQLNKAIKKLLDDQGMRHAEIYQATLLPENLVVPGAPRPCERNLYDALLEAIQLAFLRGSRPV